MQINAYQESKKVSIEVNERIFCKILVSIGISGTTDVNWYEFPSA